MYDEVKRPSSVDRVQCTGIDDEVDRVLASLAVQRMAYPDEVLGVLCVRKDDVGRVRERLEQSQFAGEFACQDEAFVPNMRVFVSTVHSAKGLEFRTAHVVGANACKGFRGLGM